MQLSEEQGGRKDAWEGLAGCRPKFHGVLWGTEPGTES